MISSTNIHPIAHTSTGYRVISKHDISHLAIVSVSHKELRSSVPPCGDVVREFLVWRAPYESGEAEVAYLEDPILGQEHVLGLEVSVDDAVGVDELAGLQNLPYYFLGLNLNY